MLFLARILFQDIGKNIGKGEVVFRIGVSTMSIVFALFHAFFFIYYLVVGAYSLLPVNTICFACYILIILLNKSRMSKTSGLLFVTLPAIYAVIAVYIVGWNVGAQWYLLALLIPVYMMYEKFGSFARRVYVCFLFIAMIVCYFIGMTNVPYYADLLLMPMEISNICLAMIGSIMSMEVLNFGSLFNQRRYQSKIANLSDEANKDPITKMWNRRYIENMLTNIFWDDQVARDRIFIAMIDIDMFKSVNDEYSHEVGDDILKKFSQVMLKGFRSTDIIARWGGEEFIVVLNDTDEKGASRALDNFRLKLQHADFVVEGKQLELTVTVGFVSCKADDSYLECIKLSDEALYYGKNNGRNKVVNYREVPGAKSID